MITICALIGVITFLIIRFNSEVEESSPPSDAISYVALGDSYTIGQGVAEDERWPNQLVKKLSDENIKVNLVANPSVTGFTSSDLLENKLDALRKYQPDFITIQIGVNDYFRGASEEAFRVSFSEVISNVTSVSPSAKILIITIPDYGKTPAGARTGNPETIHSGLKRFNAIISEVASSYQLPIADVFEASLNVEADSELVARDGLHPSAKQYSLWLETIYPKARELL